MTRVSHITFNLGQTLWRDELEGDDDDDDDDDDDGGDDDEDDDAYSHATN